jgi:hypothetical protein
MTIHVKVENLDSRANAVIEVLTEDTYHTIFIDGVPLKTTTYVRSEGLLRGGESLETYLTSTQFIKVIERQNG